MSFTILQRSRQGIRSVKVTKAGLTALLSFALLLPVVTGYVGYRWAIYQGHLAAVDESTIESWRGQLKQQQIELDTARSISHQQLNALTARVGILQAHIRRLDAAGERIAHVSGIDPKEFNFRETPAIGGPEGSDELGEENNTGDFLSLLNDLGSQLLSREQQLSALESLVFDKHMGVEQYISGRPITKGWMSSFYGRRTDPFTGRPSWHPGIDFAGELGSDVVATAAGVVSFAGKKGGLGYLVEISHGDGLITRYGHNSEVLVEEGDVVSKNQRIALMGSTGRSTGAHVHYEILKDGRKVNPLKYVNRPSKR